MSYLEKGPLPRCQFLYKMSAFIHGILVWLHLRLPKSGTPSHMDKYTGERQALLSRSDDGEAGGKTGPKSLSDGNKGWKNHRLMQRYLQWWGKREPRPFWLSSDDSTFTHLRETYYERVNQSKCA